MTLRAEHYRIHEKTHSNAEAFVIFENSGASIDSVVTARAGMDLWQLEVRKSSSAETIRRSTAEMMRHAAAQIIELAEKIENAADAA